MGLGQTNKVKLVELRRKQGPKGCLGGRGSNKEVMFRERGGKQRPVKFVGRSEQRGEDLEAKGQTRTSRCLETRSEKGV